MSNPKESIRPTPERPETLPPKDGLVVSAHLRGRVKNAFIFWDPSWGGRGGWFTMDNKAVAEKDIFVWEPRVHGAADFETVARLNYDIEQERKKNKA